MDVITKASFDAAKNAVTLAITLIGAMALWLGIMKVAENAGLMPIMSRAIRPLMTWLFPDVPADHPAMSAMIMNIAANMLGLGNAATPMGIKAMGELDKLNPARARPRTAMCLFLAINTSNVSLLPLGVIAVRAAAGASSPGSILDPDHHRDHDLRHHLPASRRQIFSPAGKALIRSPRRRRRTMPMDSSEESAAAELFAGRAWRESFSPCWSSSLFSPPSPIHFIVTKHLPAFNYDLLTRATGWLIPLLMGFFLLFGYFRGVKVYESLTDGAKEGFQVAVRIIPFLVAIFVAIGMFRESGALDLFRVFSPLFSRIGFPVEALPVAFLRPLSGTGSFAAMSEMINHAPDCSRRSSSPCCRARPRPPFMSLPSTSAASESGDHATR